MKTYYPRAKATETTELAVLALRICKRDNIKPKDLAVRARMTPRHFSVVTGGRQDVPKYTADDVARALEIPEKSFGKYFQVIDDPSRVDAANATPPPPVRAKGKPSDKSAAA